MVRGGDGEASLAHLPSLTLPLSLELGQVGDASAQCSTQVPRICHLTIPTLARSDMPTYVLIRGSGHSSIAEAPAAGDSDESSWASDNYNEGRDDTSSSDSDGRVQSNDPGSKPVKARSEPFEDRSDNISQSTGGARYFQTESNCVASKWVTPQQARKQVLVGLSRHLVHQ